MTKLLRHRGFDAKFLLTRLLRGVTQRHSKINRRAAEFLLTRLLRGVTAPAMVHLSAGKISTHTPLARRDTCGSRGLNFAMISTHTRLARRDNSLYGAAKLNENFYSHASCEA